MIIEFEATCYQDDGEKMVVNIEAGHKGDPIGKVFIAAYEFPPYAFRHDGAEEVAARKFCEDLRVLVQTLRDQEASYV